MYISAERLLALRPAIDELMRIGGTPGISLGVMQHGKPIFNAVYGFRDAANRVPLDEETILPVCSLTKAVTAAALGILIDEGKATWDSLIKDISPDYNISDGILQNELTITDLLCHRAGMSSSDNLFLGTENNILISKENAMAYLNSQTRPLPFRKQFAYNNLAFELAGKVIEALSGEDTFAFIQRRIFDPLGMKRTSLQTPTAQFENVAKCYNALDDGSTAEIPCVKAGDDWFFGSAAGMRSCVRDLQTLYHAFMVCYNDQTATGKTSTQGVPLRQVAMLMSLQIAIDPSDPATTYGLGWAIAQTPCKFGYIGINPGLMPNGMLIVGKGAPNTLVVYHQGSLPGALTLNMLLPETTTSIVVLSNSLALNDVPDWVGQLVLEELLGVPQNERVDFVSAAIAARDKNLEWCPTLSRELQAKKKPKTSHRELARYIGTFWDGLRLFKIVVTQESDGLYWALQGLDSENFRLSHYQDDTFLWLQPRNELARRGRWVGADQGLDFWKVRFRFKGESGHATSLFWVHDNDVPEVEYILE